MLELGCQAGSCAGSLTGNGFHSGFMIWIFVLISMVSLSQATDFDATQRPWKTVAAQQNVMPPSQGSVETIVKGQQSGIRESLQIASRNQAEWNALWKRHASIEAVTAPRPIVDFSNEIVVGVFLGEKSTGGYDVQIVDAKRTDDTLWISFTEKTPQPGAIVLQAVTQPFHIVRVRVSGIATVSFRRLS